LKTLILTTLPLGLLLAVILAKCVPLMHAATPSQAQASELAVPEPSQKITNIITVIQCRQLIAMIMVDEHGEVHWINIEGMTPAQSLIVAQRVTADHVHAITVGCASPSDAVI
jgi:hypothetical protein